MADQPRIAVVGLGYIGLPLAMALARSFEVVGFDVDRRRIAELREGRDRTGEVDADVLAATNAEFADDASRISGSDVFVVAVPTPVTSDRRPDLGAVEAASLTVGAALGKGAVVVYESTVYPGVTEDFCGPLLERASGLVCGRDFLLGYSPERVNPGDRDHGVERVDKVVAGQTPEAADTLCRIYGKVTSGKIFRAADIRTAEAAKIVENVQRDVNIAFVNEMAAILDRMGISTHDVLDAAATKWNFLDFRPGLVGGHCIGVDPYYLVHAAESVGHRPELVRAGRSVNENMGERIAERIAGKLGRGAGSRILVLGLTFKENLSDLRNTGVAGLVSGLGERGFKVDVHDARADPGEARELLGIDLLPCLGAGAPHACVVGAVAHDAYRNLSADGLAALVEPDGLVADVKGMWRDLTLGNGVRRWQI